jgi:hypothetical protein
MNNIMKFVYQFRHSVDTKSIDTIMEIVKCCAQTNDNRNNDTDFIYIEYKNKMYKFNRYDEKFIAKVEEARALNPYKYLPDEDSWGHLHICNIDDRFSNKKYYNIKNINNKNQECVEILTDIIIEDLYHNRLLEK